MRALCLALTLMLAAPSAAQDMDALFREGIEAVLVGEHDRAIAAYEEQDANGKRWQPTSRSVLSLEGGNGMSKLIVLCFGVVALAATSAIADSDRAAIMEELKEWQKQREATLAIAKCWFSESRLDKKQYASTRVMIST